MRSIRAACCIAAVVLAAPAAHAAAFAGLWFQCQPKWNADKNYLLVDIRPGDRAWDAKWGTANSARGAATADGQGNLQLRGCHAIGGKPAASCNAAKPPIFAVLPRALTTGASQPKEVALRSGAWMRTDKASLDQLARQCGGLRPKAQQK